MSTMKSIREKLAEAVHAELADPSVELKIGKASLPEHAQTRRVVWIPVRSPFTGKSATVHAPSSARGRAQIINTFAYTFELHIYAGDDADVEDLAFNLVAAADRVAGANASPSAISWPTEEDGKSGKNLRQPKAILAIQFNTGVTGEIKKLRPIEGFLLTQTIRQPAGDVSEPPAGPQTE
jgi:hypothetical protein